MTAGRAGRIALFVVVRIICTLGTIAISLFLLGMGTRFAYQQPMNSPLTFPIIAIVVVLALGWPFLLRLRRK
jgi:hypothetical protein